MLSLGTGTSLTYQEGMNLDWGMGQWVRPLISILMDGVSGIADFQCRKLLQENYHRLAPVFPPGVKIDMDGVEHIALMIEYAAKVDISDTVKWLKRSWLQLEE
jgi:hypothetical protein